MAKVYLRSITMLKKFPQNHLSDKIILPHSKKQIMKIIIAFTFSFLSILALNAQTAQDSLSQKLTKIANETVIPGFAVAVVSRDKIHYKKSFGYADIASQKPYQTSTIQNIGSTSKTFIGVAIMHAIEQGLFTLDTPINDILSTKIIHPKYPETPITIRHLAAHTSGIEDTNKFFIKDYVPINHTKAQRKNMTLGQKFIWKLMSKSKMMSLSGFLLAYLTPNGEYYSKKNFKSKPGTVYSYTNAGAGLAALVLQEASGMPFEDYTQKYIFEPTKMANTGWSFDKVDMEKHATLYHPKKVAVQPQYTLCTFPDGGLLTSIDDLAVYTQEVMKMVAGESPIMTQASGQEMITDRLPASKEERKTGYGVFWDVAEIAAGHGGSDPGANSLVYFFPEQNIAVLFIVNMNLDGSKKTKGIYREIWRALRNYSKGVAE